MPDSSLLSRLTKFNLAALCVMVLLLSLIKVTAFLTDIVALMAAALIMTYLLRGPVRCIETVLGKLQGVRSLSEQARKTMAIICVYLLLAGILALTGMRLAPVMVSQFRELAQDVPQYMQRMETPGAYVRNSDRQLGELVKQSWEETRHQQVAGTTMTQTVQGSQTEYRQFRRFRIINATWNLVLKKLTENYQQYASRLGGVLLDIGTSTLTAVVFVLTMLVLVFMLLHGGHHLKDGVVDLMPSSSEGVVAEFLERVHRQLFNFINGQALVSVVGGGLMYVLLLLLDVKYALVLAVFYGLASILPVIGPWIGLIPIALLEAFQGNPMNILHVLIFNGLFYLLKVYWLWPKLIHSRYDIHPVIIIISFIVCLKVVGYLGILLFFPLASVLGVWLEMMRDTRLPENGEHV